MSISSEISRIQGNVADAYTALSVKGATMPSLRNTANLKSTIESIEMMTAEAMSIETIRAICVTLSDFEKNYTALEYIQSSGTQYIDTSFKANQDSSVIMDVALSGSADIQSVFGARTSASSKTFATFWMSSGYFRLHYYNGYSNFTAGPSDPTIRCTIKHEKNVLTIGETTLSRTYNSFQTEYNLLLLAVNQAGSASLFASAKLYGCQVYDNGTIVRDFVPCVRNSDGAVGLYDKVTETFYGNAGSGSFTGA